MIKMIVIELAAMEWAAVVVLAPKEGIQIPFFVDYSRLHAVSARDPTRFENRLLHRLIRRRTSIFHTCCKLRLFESRERQCRSGQNSFYFASWAVEMFKNVVLVAQRN